MEKTKKAQKSKQKMNKEKRKIQKKCTYTEQLLQKALTEIREGASKKSTALKYNIPRPTLQFRLGTKFTKVEKGRNTYLTKAEETKLVNWIVENERKGFPRRQVDLQAAVKSFLDANPRSTPFKNNLPGEHWYKLFIKRHPALTERTPEGVTNSSACVSEKDIKGWFRQIEDYLKTKNLYPILKDPKRIFNGDETCFQFCPKLGKVIAPKGKKNIYEIDRGNAKQNLTVMFTFSAAGDTTPPMVIYPNKRLPKNILDGIPSTWGIGLSDNGWMKSEVFVDCIKNVLHPYLAKKHTEFPIILFVDGHTTHLSLELSDLCTQLQIVLVSLYPNSTRLLQPADVSSFRPLKYLWKKSVLDWRRENPYINLTKEHFAPILKRAVNGLKAETIINGFKACGLFPWNANALDFTKCLGKPYSLPKDQSNNSEKILESILAIFDQHLQTEIKGNLRVECTQQQCKYFEILQSIYEKLPTSSKTANDSMFSVADFENMPIIIEDILETDTIQKTITLDDFAKGINAAVTSSFTDTEIQDSVQKETNISSVDIIATTNVTERDCDISGIISTDTTQKTITLDDFAKGIIAAVTSSFTDTEIQDSVQKETNISSVDIIATTNVTERDCDISAIISTDTIQKTITLDDFANGINAAVTSSFTDTEIQDSVQKETNISSMDILATTNVIDRDCDISAIISTSEQDLLFSMINDIKNIKEIENQFPAPVIDNFLSAPQTPVRKGVRQTERASFVLTSSDYKENALEKARQKQKKEQRKLENKQRKMLKSEGVKQKRPRSNKIIDASNNIIESGKNHKNHKNQQKMKHVRNLKNILDNQTIIPKTSHVCSTASKQNYIDFTENFEVKSKSEILTETQQNLETENPSRTVTPHNHIAAPKGLCFCCVHNIYGTNPGIKCQHCSRTYHVKCLQKQNIFRDFFVCKTCSVPQKRKIK